MKRYPFVSIITVGFNRKKWFEKNLPRLKELNYPKKKYEVIIVDDGSTDSTMNLASKFKWVKFFRQKHKGPAAARNLGAENAKGDYLYFIDSDVILEKDSLIELVKVAESNKRIGICGSKIVNISDKVTIQNAGEYLNFLGIIVHRGMNEKDRGQFNRIEEVFSVPSCSLLVRRGVVKKLKYCFDPSYFIFYEDVDFCWRAKLLGYGVVYVPSSVIFHREHSKSGPKPISIYRTYQNKIWSFRKNFRFPLKHIFLTFVSLEILVGILFWWEKKKWDYGMDVFKHLRTPINKGVNLNSIPLKKQISLLSFKI